MQIVGTKNWINWPLSTWLPNPSTKKGIIKLDIKKVIITQDIKKGIIKQGSLFIGNYVNIMHKWIVNNGLNSTITEAKEPTFLWDFAIQTERNIKSKRSDILVKEYTRKISLQIDMTAQTDDNVSVKWYF